jgi:probable phosphoglycerate mutase
VTTFFLIRHAANDSVGRGIAGRSAGVHLNAAGREQAESLARRLAHAGIGHLYCSPLERARETAQPLAEALGVPINVLESLQEVDFGDWTGRSFELLDKEPRWGRFNRIRSITRIPGGELMIETQLRMVTALEELRQAHPEGRVAVVSHGDPIRSALIYYAGISIDLMQNIRVDLASVSVLALEEEGACILCLNHSDECPAA